MSSLKISKIMSGIPTPTARRGPVSDLAKALWEMEIDQCRDIRDSYANHDCVMKRVSRFNQLWPGRRYQCRKENDAVRVWRVQ